MDRTVAERLGGLILWSKSFTPAFSALTVTPASPINVLVKEAFIEGKSRNEQDGIERDGYSVRWTMENGLGLVFVVSTQILFQQYTPSTYYSS
jgi:signal recognition particle receptor subunit alpha